MICQGWSLQNTNVLNFGIVHYNIEASLWYGLLMIDLQMCSWTHWLSVSHSSSLSPASAHFSQISGSGLKCWKEKRGTQSLGDIDCSRVHAGEKLYSIAGNSTARTSWSVRRTGFNQSGQNQESETQIVVKKMGWTVFFLKVVGYKTADLKLCGSKGFNQALLFSF